MLGQQPRRVDLGQPAGRDRLQQLGEVAVDQRHDRLAFGVAEADIIFDQLGAVGGQHQPRIKHAAERRSGIRHARARSAERSRPSPAPGARRSAPGPAHKRPCRRCWARCRLRRRACDPGPKPAATAVSPSTSANRLASSPSRNSSMTSGPSPAASIAASASSRRHGDGDALAGGEPVGLDHHRQPEAVQRGVGLGHSSRPAHNRRSGWRWPCTDPW